jgi:hypothetical protein
VALEKQLLEIDLGLAIDPTADYGAAVQRNDTRALASETVSKGVFNIALPLLTAKRRHASCFHHTHATRTTIGTPLCTRGLVA